MAVPANTRKRPPKPPFNNPALRELRIWLVCTSKRGFSWIMGNAPARIPKWPCKWKWTPKWKVSWSFAVLISAIGRVWEWDASSLEFLHLPHRYILAIISLRVAKCALRSLCDQALGLRFVSFEDGSYLTSKFMTYPSLLAIASFLGIKDFLGTEHVWTVFSRW